MEELIDLIVQHGKDLSVLDLAIIWFVYQAHRELFKPARVLLIEYTAQLKKGGFTHNGMEAALKKLDGTIQVAGKARKPSQS